MLSGGEPVGWRIWQIRRAHQTLACLPFARGNAMVGTGCLPYNELAAG